MDKRSAVHQCRRGARWTSLSLVHPTAGIMNAAAAMYPRPYRISVGCLSTSGNSDMIDAPHLTSLQENPK
nr:hypothetical protein [Thiocapsa sp. KS1]